MNSGIYGESHKMRRNRYISVMAAIKVFCLGTKSNLVLTIIYIHLDFIFKYFVSELWAKSPIWSYDWKALKFYLSLHKSTHFLRAILNI